MHLDKLKGTLVDFNELEHILDDAPGIGAWQLELRKRNNDPLELDEVLLHVERNNGLTESELTRDLNRRFAERTEFHPNRILFHDTATMRELQGVGTQLKEQKVVDHRPQMPVAHTTPEVTGTVNHPNHKLSEEIEVAT